MGKTYSSLYELAHDVAGREYLKQMREGIASLKRYEARKRESPSEWHLWEDVFKSVVLQVTQVLEGLDSIGMSTDPEVANAREFLKRIS